MSENFIDETRDRGGKKRGRKPRPIATTLMRSDTGSRRIRRYSDEEQRDRALRTMTRAGEIQDGRPWHSFDEVMNGYLEDAGVPSKRYAGDSFDIRERAMRDELLPVFTGKSIRAVTPLALDQLRADVINRRGGNAWRWVGVAMQHLVEFAISEGWLTPWENPFVELPAYVPHLSRTVLRQSAVVNELSLPSLDQIHLLLNEATGWLKMALSIILIAGLRTGELRALRWRHVLLDSKNRVATIEVKVAVKHDDTEGPPKTSAGERDVHVKGPLYDLLEAMHPGKDGAARHVVLVPAMDATGGLRPLLRGELYRHLMKLQVSIGIGSREKTGHHSNYSYSGCYAPHMLRHAAVAWWIWRGVPDGLIQYWIGHANLSTTLGTYGYLFDAHERGDEKWSGGPSPAPAEDEDSEDEEDSEDDENTEKDEGEDLQ